MYAAARDQGLIIVGGECQDVGIFGGYIQGGGHSPLASIYGMGADNVLGFEVVTSDGRFVSANEKENPDLFWALRGGGGSTFGVVTSVTVKAYPELEKGITVVSFEYTNANISNTTFWAGYRTYLDYFSMFADARLHGYFFFIPIGNGLIEFNMQALWAPNTTINETTAILEPWTSQLSNLGITISPVIKHFTTFWSAWNYSYPLAEPDWTHKSASSRLWPRRNWSNSSILNATFSAQKAAVEAGHMVIAYNFAPTWERGGRQNTSINPAWRETLSHIQALVSWEKDSEQWEARRKFTFGTQKRWRELSPGAGAYLNEGDRIAPGFQWSFYGSFYPKLLDLKKKYDPRNLFWAATAVGSEFFEVRSADGLPNENGRLCRKKDSELYIPEGPDWVPH